MADTPSIRPTNPASEAKVYSAGRVKKYELGSGKNRINVWIFKEPAEPVLPASQKDTRTKQVEPDSNLETKIEPADL